MSTIFPRNRPIRGPSGRLQEEQPPMSTLVLDMEMRTGEVFQGYFLTLFLYKELGSIKLLDSQTGNTIAYVPQQVYAIVVGPGKTIEDEGELKQWMESQGLNVPVISYVVGLEVILSDASQRSRVAAEANVQLALRLAEIRAIHEELQNSYDALRTFAAEHSLLPPKIGFSNPIDIDGQTVLCEFQIKQPIPVDLRSLCGVSLHVGVHSPPFSEGSLEVELFASDDDSIFFTWIVPYNKIVAGWVTFAFEQTGTFIRKNPVLRLTYRTVVGHGPWFSAGGPQFRANQTMYVDGGLSEHSLAFKAWSSVPGAPLTLSNQMSPAIRADDKPITHLTLEIDDGLLPVDVRRLQDTTGWPVIVVLSDRNRLMVHPVGAEPTIAQISNACPSGTSFVTAEVETDSDQAGPIDYAIAVGSKSIDLLSLEASDASQMSDWVRLPCRTIGTVYLQLRAPLTKSEDLYLMTRVADSRSYDFAWAHFTKVVFKGNFG